MLLLTPSHPTHIAAQLKDVVLSSIAFGDKETRLYNEMRLKHWATDFPSFVCEQSGWPRPWSWMRARYMPLQRPRSLD